VEIGGEEGEGFVGKDFPRGYNIVECAYVDVLQRSNLGRMIKVFFRSGSTFYVKGKK
jgi:hypothetical protein